MGTACSSPHMRVSGSTLPQRERERGIRILTPVLIFVAHAGRGGKAIAITALLRTPRKSPRGTSGSLSMIHSVPDSVQMHKYGKLAKIARTASESRGAVIASEDENAVQCAAVVIAWEGNDCCIGQAHDKDAGFWGRWK